MLPIYGFRPHRAVEYFIERAGYDEVRAGALRLESPNGGFSGVREGVGDPVEGDSFGPLRLGEDLPGGAGCGGRFESFRVAGDPLEGRLVFGTCLGECAGQDAVGTFLRGG